MGSLVLITGTGTVTVRSVNQNCHESPITWLICFFAVFLSHLLSQSYVIMSRARNWCFTWNNPDGSMDVDIEHDERIVYAVWQLEVGAQGTEHFQGYLEYDRPVTIGQIKKGLWIDGIHVKPRMGTREQARDYCMKEDSRLDGPWEKGEFGHIHPGRRNDLMEVKSYIDSGGSLLGVADNFFGSFIRYGRGIGQYMALKRPKRNFKTIVYVFVGLPRCGKSTTAKDWGGEEAYWLPRGTWFDGYDGQDTVVIDDFYGWLPCDLLLRACDRFPLMVPTKGGHVNFTPTSIILTSNKLPHLWYKTNAWDFRAMAGRVEAWYFFEDPDFESDPTRFEKYEDLVSYYRENYGNEDSLNYERSAERSDNMDIVV